MATRRQLIATIAAVAALAVVSGIQPALADAFDCDGCIDKGDIGADAVGTSEILTGGVGKPEIATDAVGGSEIVNGSVSSSDLADSAKTTLEHATATTVAVSSTATIGSVALGAGTWWVLATFSMDNLTEGTDVYVTCVLRSNLTTVDQRAMHLDIGDGGTGNTESVSMQTRQTFDSTTTVSVVCTPEGTPSDLYAKYVKLSALKILNPI